MPFQSKAQARLFFAAAKGGVEGLDKETAKKFIKDSKGQRVSKLPEKKRFGKLKKIMESKRG